MLCFHIRLPGLGILSKIFGKFMLEIGEKNESLVALGTGSIFGPKIGPRKNPCCIKVKIVPGE